MAWYGMKLVQTGLAILFGALSIAKIFIASLYRQVWPYFLVCRLLQKYMQKYLLRCLLE